MIRSILAAALAACLAVPALASARALTPAHGARTVAGNARAAEQTAGSVDVRVDPGAWRAGRWGAVQESLAPVRVTITNRSGRPVRVTYPQFGLVSPWGVRLGALAPYEVAGEPQIASSPRRSEAGFVSAPWPPQQYGLADTGAPAPGDRLNWELQQEDVPAIPPNEDVVRRALPEGILEPGGTVSGFLYFQDEPRGTALTFVANVVDAASGRPRGTVAIPFTVE